RAARAIAQGPIESLGFATLDHHRALRVGFPEVVFGMGKTPAQLVTIVRRLAAKNPVVLATRVDDAGRAALAAAFPEAEIHDRARIVIVRTGTGRGGGAGGLPGNPQEGAARDWRRPPTTREAAPGRRSRALPRW